jgi:hypothetical protein
LLDPAQVSALELHLGSCPDCRSALEVARAENAGFAAAARLDGPFPLFEAPAPAGPATLPLRTAWTPFTAGRWPWVAAAAVLLAAALPFAGFRLGAMHREQIAARAEQDLLAANQLHAEFRERTNQEDKQAVERLESRLVRLAVHGPSDLQAGHPSLFQVDLTDYANRPASARLVTRVTPEKGGAPLFEQVVKAEGNVAVQVPPLPVKEGARAQLEFLVDSSEGPERVREILEISPAPRATFLTTHRQIYRPGDKVLFRSITLDRATHRPGTSPAAIQYRLAGPDTRPVAVVSGMTRPEGIGEGEFTLDARAKPGVYTLTATDADGLFAPVTHAFRVAGAPDRPATLSEISFVPEGGALIAGVPTRIYFDARDSNRESIELEATVLDSKQRVVGKIEKNPQNSLLGRGFFLLTPRPGELYTVRPNTGAAQGPRYSLPRVQETGLGLSVENPVLNPRETVRATVFNPAGHKVTVVAALVSDARLLAARTVTLHAGANSLQLPAPEHLAGVFRVALFPSGQGAAAPVAERLGFCHAGSSLPVAWERLTRNGKQFLRIRNGAGTPEKSWFAISLQPAEQPGILEHAAGQNLWSAMVLEAELPQGELERRRRSLWLGDDTAELLRDEPGRAASLAIYLGLQSPVQRRQPPADARPAFANSPNPTADSPSFALLKADNSASVRAKFSSALAGRAAAIGLEDRELAAQVESARSRLEAARSNLQSYQEHAAALFQPLLGLLVISLFSVGCIGLSVSIWRIVQNQPGARGWVLSAAGALGVCLAFVGLSPLRFDTFPSFPQLAPVAALDLKTPEPGAQFALAGQEPVRGHTVMSLQTGARPIVDRTKQLTGSSAPTDLLWRPGLPADDGVCELEITTPAGKFGRLLQIDVFTASGKLGSAAAVLKD